MSTPVMTCVFTCPHASPFLLKERMIDTCQGAVLGGSGILMAIGASSAEGWVPDAQFPPPSLWVLWGKCGDLGLIWGTLI